jgi:hypothetical protein
VASSCIVIEMFVYFFLPVVCFVSIQVFTYSYEEALQMLADSEIKRETIDKEIRSVRERRERREKEGEES